MEATKMRVKNKYFSITPDVVEKMKEADINPDILRQRLASGWKFEDAIEVIESLKVPIIAFTFGIPNQNIIKRLHNAGKILIGTATSVEEAVEKIAEEEKVESKETPQNDTQ